MLFTFQKNTFDNRFLLCQSKSCSHWYDTSRDLSRNYFYPADHVQTKILLRTICESCRQQQENKCLRFKENLKGAQFENVQLHFPSCLGDLSSGLKGFTRGGQ